MLCNHVLFCAPARHLPGGATDQERWPQQNPGQGIQGIAAEQCKRPLCVIHAKNPLAFAVVIINTHAQATWASLSWGSDAFLSAIIRCMLFFLMLGCIV